MLSTKFAKITFTLLLCLVSFLVLTSCAFKSNRFGIIFTAGNEASGLVDIYHFPDNTQSKVEQLTFTPTVGEYQLRVSKTGDKIIFQTGYVDPLEETSVKQRHVYLLDTTSKEFIDITNFIAKYTQVWDGFSMDWSPDQKQFMVVDHEVIGHEIKSFLEFIDFYEKDRKDILIPATGEMPSLIQTAKWSPDAKKVVLTQEVIGIDQKQQYPGSAILVYDLDTGHVIQITDYQDHCLPREWSPTSRQIVATCSYIPPNSITVGSSVPETVRILDVENHGQPYERIAFSSCYDPSWSPNGKQITFVCDEGANQAGLFIANSDSSGILEVDLGDLEPPIILKNPTWSPDGTQIVYVAGPDAEHTKIYSVNVDGSNNHALINQDAFYTIEAVYPLP